MVTLSMLQVLTQFFPVVYPVVVTDLRPFFCILYVFIGFQSNLVTEIYFNGPFMCAKFPRVCICILCLNLQSVQNEENEEEIK